MATLLDLANQKLSDATAEQAAAGTALASALTALAAAQAAKAQAAADAASIDDQQATIRRQLAVTPMPADGAALLAQLETLIVQSHAKAAQLVAADDAALAAQQA